MNTYRIPNLARACQVLKLLAVGNERLGSSHVARRLAMPRTTVLRILHTLAAEGLLVREGNDFRAGPELVRLGLAALGSTPVRERSVPVLRALSEKTGETAHLVVLSGERGLILEVCDSPNPVRVASRPGSLVHLHCSATGKLFLAHVLRSRLGELAAARAFTARTPGTLTSVEQLEAECDRIVRQGYALDDEEYHLGVRCLAAPVWDGTGALAAAIGITASTASFTKRRLPEVAPHVLAAAASLSRSLGFDVTAAAG